MKATNKNTTKKVVKNEEENKGVVNQAIDLKLPAVDLDNTVAVRFLEHVTPYVIGDIARIDKILATKYEKNNLAEKI